MSTRCNVIIKYDNYSKPEQKILYRHHDGYIEETGKNLVETLEQNMGYFTEFGNSFLDELPRRYEDTDQIHGDIEYVYVIDLDKKNPIIKAYERKDWDKDKPENWEQWPCEIIFQGHVKKLGLMDYATETIQRHKLTKDKEQKPEHCAKCNNDLITENDKGIKLCDDHYTN